MSKPTRFSNAKDFEKWLAKNHDSSTEIWLELAKKGADFETLTYAEALDVALCYGWIDAQKKGNGEHAWLQRFTPRTKTSKWSTINRDKAEALVKAKRMRPAGLAQMEAAKKDGRWARAYDGAKKSEVPPDLEHALAKNARARAFFVTLDSANRYAILYRLHHTEKPELRAKKIVRFVEMLAAGETLHPRAAAKRAVKPSKKPPQPKRDS